MWTSSPGCRRRVAIEQRITRGGGKSTVATVTEVYHFLRLLFAKLGTQFCPKCDVPVEKQTLAAVTKKAEALARKGPHPRARAARSRRAKVSTPRSREWAERQGFEELLVDGKFVRAERFESWSASASTPSTCWSASARRTARVQRAGEARARDRQGHRAAARSRRTRRTSLSTEMSCPGCGDSFEELDPRLFSFNSPHGWCAECHGFGEVWKACSQSAARIRRSRSRWTQERQHEWLDEGEARAVPELRRRAAE